MVSDDTKDKTEELLIVNNYFGLHASQVTIMKQEKVAALLDNDARIALSEPYVIDSKPHGHGDVHALMHSTMTARKWLQMGVKWVVFFQDTNGLSILTLPAMLAVSLENNYEVNSLAVPRKAKQAVGAITKLKDKRGNEMTINIEYNQLDPLLRATINSEGDVNDRDTGLSAFPGNINQFVNGIDAFGLNTDTARGVRLLFQPVLVLWALWSTGALRLVRRG
jgi:UDP-sugar pyrophosphorylase